MPIEFAVWHARPNICEHYTFVFGACRHDVMVKVDGAYTPQMVIISADHLLLLHIEDSHCSVFVTDCQLFLRPFDTADTPFCKFLSLVAAPTPNIGYIAQRYCYQVILVPVQQVVVEVIL